MASTNTNTTLELLQLLTALGVQIDHDPALAQLSPAFLEARLQTYLGFAQREVLKPGQSKLEIGGEVEDVGKVSLKEYEMGPLHGGHDHGHGHSHDGNDHGHSHDGNDHGHDHSHGAHAGAPAHSHSHGENDHGHSHGGGAAAAAVGDHGHGHTHDGEPCGGHDDEGGDEEDDEEEGDPSGEQINQVLRALRHYLSALTQGILQAWSRPPLFPGAPRHNMWVLREPTRDGKPSPTNLGHDLVLTIAGAATIPSPTTTSSSTSSTSPPEEGVEEAEEEAQPPTPVILLHYAHDSPAARKGLWGNTMQMNLPREILHLLSVLLDSNSKKCPSFRAVPEAQVGLASNGFKPSFLVPVSEAHPDEDKIGKLDLKKEVFGKLVECDVCGLLGPDLKCAKCKGRTYCSAGCQRKDWKEHKGNCAK